MTEHDDKPTEGLERLLRHWGAEQAAREAAPPERPAPPAFEAAPPKHRGGTLVLRWAPLAAAAGLLVAAVAFFVAGPVSRRGTEMARQQADQLREPEAATAPTQAGETTAQVERLRAELEAALAAKQAAEARLEGAVPREQHEAQLARLREEFLADKAALIAGMSARIAGLNQAVEARSREADAAAERVEALTEQLAAAKSRAEAAEQRLAAAAPDEQFRKRHEALAAEYANLLALHRESMTRAREAEAAFSTAQVRTQTLMDNFQRLYVSAVAPGREGLAARRSASRRTAMVARCGELARRTDDRQMAELLRDAVVLFTRLELLDPRDADEARAFGALVARSNVVERIDRLLAAGKPMDEARTTLFEAKLILSGAEHVG